MNRTRPICTGINAKGELTWAMVHMELWHILQLYRRQYQGDFGENWMYLCAYNSGWDWENHAD